jgi:hypothetical protein
MANLLEYDMRVVGMRSIDAAFAHIERRIQAHNQYVARATGTTTSGATRTRSGVSLSNDARIAAQQDLASKRAQAAADRQKLREQAAGARAAAREEASRQRQSARESVATARASARAELAAKRQAAKDAAATQKKSLREVSELERQQRAEQRYWQRARLRSEGQRYREEQRLSRQSLRQARQQAQERVAFVQSTIGNSASRVGRTMSAVGTAGLALTGIAGTALAAGAITQATALDEGSRRLAIQGRDVGEKGANADDLRRRFTQIGVARGIAPEDVMRGAAAYTAETGDLGAAMSNLDTFATVAQGAGASIEEIATAAAHLRKLGITSVDDMRQSLASLTMQGKKGSFEIKNMAAEFPEVTAQAANFGIRGVRGLQQVGGLMQVAKTATGSGAEASTAVQTMFRQLAAGATDIQSGKAFEGRAVNVFEKGNTKGKLRDFREILGDVLVASRGDLPQLQEVFDVRGIKAVNPLISKFREVRSESLAGGATEKEASARGRTAALAVLDNAANVPGDFNEIQRDSADAMKAWSVQVAVLEAQFKDVISSNLFPELVRLAPAMRDMVPAVRTATRALVAVGEFFVNHPIAGIGAIIATQVAIDVGKAKLGLVLKGLIERFFGQPRTALPGTGGTVGSSGGGAATVAGGPGFFGRPTRGAMAMAAGTGLLIGAGVGASIYGNGIGEFEASEDRMVQSGRDLNLVRGAGLGDIDSVKERIASKRSQVAKLKRTSIFDDAYEGVYDLFGGGPTSRQVELNTETNSLAEMERKLASLEEEKSKGGGSAAAMAPALQGLSTGSDAAAKSLDTFSKKIEETGARLDKIGRGDQPNRGDAPSPVKG